VCAAPSKSYNGDMLTDTTSTSPVPSDDETTPDNAPGYPPDSMRVERSETPDGRLLLYFTFPDSMTADAATTALSSTGTNAPGTRVDERGEEPESHV